MTEAGQNQAVKISPVKKWLMSLMGKPIPKNETQASTPGQSMVQDKASSKPNDTAQKETPKIPQAVDLEEANKVDVIQSDLKKFKEYFSAQMAKIKATMGGKMPIGSELSANAGNAASAAMFTNRKFIKKTLTIFVTGLVAVIIIFVAVNVVKSIFKSRPGIAKTTPTPTIIEFIPDNPSKYANDSVVLNIEENVNVLDNELGRNSVKISEINLPDLDFEVKF